MGDTVYKGFNLGIQGGQGVGVYGTFSLKYMIWLILNITHRYQVENVKPLSFNLDLEQMLSSAVFYFWVYLVVFFRYTGISLLTPADPAHRRTGRKTKLEVL